MKVKVTAPYSVNWEGKNYTDGQTVDVPDVDGQGWITAGYAVAVKAETSAKTKAVKASKNKAVAESPNKGVLGTITQPDVKTTPLSAVYKAPSNK